MKQIFWAATLTLLFCVVGYLGDATFGMHNAGWNTIETLVNFPGNLVIKAVGPGHGFSQLVLPFLFCLLFYFCVFWWLAASLLKIGSHRS